MSKVYYPFQRHRLVNCSWPYQLCNRTAFTPPFSRGRPGGPQSATVEGGEPAASAEHRDAADDDTTPSDGPLAADHTPVCLREAGTHRSLMQQLLLFTAFANESFPTWRQLSVIAGMDDSVSFWGRRIWQILGWINGFLLTGVEPKLFLVRVCHMNSVFHVGSR